MSDEDLERDRLLRTIEDRDFELAKRTLRAIELRDAYIATKKKVPTFGKANEERLAKLGPTAKCAEAQRLAAEGRSPKEIAHAIGHSLSSVYDYLKRDDCSGG